MEIFANELKTVRAQKYSPERTERQRNLVNEISRCLATSQDTHPWNQVVLLLQGDESVQIIALLMIKHRVTSYPQLEAVLKVIPFTAIPHSNFVQHTARDTLSVLFRCRFATEDVVTIRQSLNWTASLARTDSDTPKRAAFTCVIGNFFDCYSLPPLSPARPYANLASSLLCMAVGDALGFLVEGQSREVCTKYVDEIVRTGKARDFALHAGFGRTGNSRYQLAGSEDSAFNFGQYTDDTQFARELLVSIRDGGGTFRVEKYARRLVAMFSAARALDATSRTTVVTGPVTPALGFGKGTAAIVQKMANGLPWSMTGSVTTQGNGCCMRAGPLGALYQYRPHLLVEVARQQALGTHASARCQGTSVMIAEAARLAIKDPWNPYDPGAFPDVFCGRLSQTVRRVDIGLAAAILELPTYLEGDAALSCIQKGRELGDGSWEGVISSSAVQSSLYAVCCFLTHPDSFLDAISMAIRPGGDVDTTAAMCGAIVGARLGENGCGDLQPFVDCINDHGEWRQTELVRLCEEVFTLVNTADS